MRTRLVALATVVGMLVASSSQAGHHLWKFTELFSNATGTVQYAELFCPANGEAGLGTFTVVSGTNTFNFVTNLPSNTTQNTWALLATSNFAGLAGGVTPDYIIPANFFPTGGGQIKYAGTIDIWNFGALPIDGVNALQRDGSSAPNSPHNFAGQSGSVDANTLVPMLPTWGIVLLIGAVLIAGSGLLRKRGAMPA
jgi:hypothetical protein